MCTRNEGAIMQKIDNRLQRGKPPIDIDEIEDRPGVQIINGKRVKIRKGKK